MEKVYLFSSYQEAKEKLKSNKTYQIEAMGKKFCMVLWQGQLYVMQDACPHRGAKLSEGKVNYLGEIVCPLHAYRFQLADGREADQKTEDAACFEVHKDENGVYFLI